MRRNVEIIINFNVGLDNISIFLQGLLLYRRPTNHIYISTFSRQQMLQISLNLVTVEIVYEPYHIFSAALVGQIYFHTLK